MNNKIILSLLLLKLNFVFAIPDFNLYLVKEKNNDKVINWSEVLKTGNKVNYTNIENINLINLNSYYVEKKIREYTTADVIFAVRDNQVEFKTKSINDNFTMISYDLNEENGCLSYSLSIIDKKTLIIRKIGDKFCYLDDINNYPNRSFTYNTPISKYSNNQNGYSYLFIFDNRKESN